MSYGIQILEEANPQVIIIVTRPYTDIVDRADRDTGREYIGKARSLHRVAKFDSGIRASRRALDRFTVSKAPVRWWHVIARTTADGQRYQKGENIRVRDAGRLRGGTRDDFDRVIIIMDVTRIGKLRFASLADYIAMVGLAQIEPEAEITGVSTVLNLFADRAAGAEPVARMTDWDKAYLKGLYAARRDVRKGDDQEKDIARSMADDLAKPAQPATPAGD